MTTRYHLKTCRLCGSRLDPVLDLGQLYPSDFVDPGATLPARMPLAFMRCSVPACGLVQLAHTVDPDSMYRQYWYRSGINETMVAELADVARQAVAHAEIAPGDKVLDIGANDGTLLQAMEATLRVSKFAVEPSNNLQSILRPHADCLIHGYFPADIPPSMFDEDRFAVITSIACFYDLDDPHAFLAAIKRLLTPRGVWVMQLQDLRQMIQASAFDNICFEHLTYWSLPVLQAALRPHNLEVVDMEARAINGGSYRFYIGHRGERPVNARVRLYHTLDTEATDWRVLERFAWEVGEVRSQLQALVGRALDTHQTIDLYGASTKANTLLQYCGFDHQILRQAWERSPEKWGKQTQGTFIPIVSEDQGRADPPKVLFAGIWQFRDAILTREAAFLVQGGTFFLPLPRAEVVTR